MEQIQEKKKENTTTAVGAEFVSLIDKTSFCLLFSGLRGKHSFPRNDIKKVSSSRGVKRRGDPVKTNEVSWSTPQEPHSFLFLLLNLLHKNKSFTSLSFSFTFIFATSAFRFASAYANSLGYTFFFPSCKNIHWMFLLRQSLRKEKKKNGYKRK